MEMNPDDCLHIDGPDLLLVDVTLDQVTVLLRGHFQAIVTGKIVNVHVIYQGKNICYHAQDITKLITRFGFHFHSRSETHLQLIRTVPVPKYSSGGVQATVTSSVS
jgi:hypothetical protein